MILGIVLAGAAGYGIAIAAFLVLLRLEKWLLPGGEQQAIVALEPGRKAA